MSCLNDQENRFVVWVKLARFSFWHKQNQSQVQRAKIHFVANLKSQSRNSQHNCVSEKSSGDTFFTQFGSCYRHLLSLFMGVNNCLWGTCLRIWKQRALLVFTSVSRWNNFYRIPVNQELRKHYFSLHFLLGCFYNTSKISHYNYINKEAHYHISLLHPIIDPELFC